MKRKMQWFAINAVMVSCAYFGLYKGVIPARNVLLFGVWMMAAVTTLCAFIITTKPELKSLAEAKGRSVPAWISVITDLAIITSLAAAGYFVSAIAAVWSMVCEAAIYTKKEAK